MVILKSLLTGQAEKDLWNSLLVEITENDPGRPTHCYEMNHRSGPNGWNWRMDTPKEQNRETRWTKVFR